MSSGARIAKRAIDIGLSASALAASLPLLGVTALAIMVEDGRPIFFKQRRSGQHGKPIDVLKFRSMRPNSIPVNELGQVGGSHPLVTRVGRIIRRLKIDELPQLLSILRGEMSLVGPRPTVPEQVAKYTHIQARRLEVPPGATGWAQVCGNTELSWDDRIALDIWYIDHWSLMLDAEILLRSVKVVALGERIDEAALREAREHAYRVGRSS